MEFGLEYYLKLVKDIENTRDKLLDKYYSKKLLDKLNKNKTKEMLDKYDELLMQCYQFIEKQIEI